LVTVPDGVLLPAAPATGKLEVMTDTAVGDNGDALWMPEPVRLQRGHRYRNERHVPDPDVWQAEGWWGHLSAQERSEFYRYFDYPATLAIALDCLAGVFLAVDHPTSELYQQGATVAILRQLWAVSWPSLVGLRRQHPRGLDWPHGYAIRVLQQHPEWLQEDYEIVLNTALDAWDELKFSQAV
jgi:hypothetical protein